MVSIEQIQEQIEGLRRQLSYHNHKYYVENSPEISDFDFDKMMRTLVDLEAQYPQFYDPLSPSVRVGSDRTTEFVSVAHRYPMLSLSNTYSIEELQQFIERIEGEINNKRAFARTRLFEEMFGEDPYGKFIYGSAEEVENITEKELFAAWQNLLSNAFVRINVIGEEEPDEVKFDI